MNWTQALSDIESHEFAARLNVVSDMRSFFAAASKEPVVAALYEELLESGASREEVLGRIAELAQLQVDRRYENPKDTPLAILLWLTTFAAADHVQMAADLVDRAPQCWYAKKLARRILMPPPVASGNSVGGEFQHSGAASTLSGDVVITMPPAARGVHAWHRAHMQTLVTSDEVFKVFG